MPPSPKKSACTKSAVLTARHAPHGPKSSASSTPPTACPVVPPGSGRLNIIARKENAAPMPSSGSRSRGISFFTLLTAMSQTGSIAAPITAHVCGLR